MQQDNNHIEDRLRQLENQQLPDLSNMDKHWQQMQQMLSGAENPTAIVKPKSFFRFGRKFFLAAAAVVITVFAAILYKATQTNTEKNNPAPIAKTGKQQNATGNPKQNETVAVQQNQTAQKTTVQPKGIQTPVVTDHSTTPVTETAQNVVAPEPVKEEDLSKETVAAFYSKIQKRIQEFTINAETGGKVTGNEGSVFIIPPSAFVDANGKIITGTVKISLQEFYKYSDMVAANLTTVSNDKQLFTGGMVKITASANGDDLTLRTNKEINLEMPTSDYDADMKLFTSSDEPTDKVDGAMYASYSIPQRNINWDLTGQQNAFFFFDGKTTFPDRLDQPYNVIKTGKKRMAKFSLSKKSSLTTDQMEKILKEKFGDYYDVIKVTREGSTPKKASNFFYRGTLDKENVIGDSVRLTLDHALRSKYIDRKDSAFFAEKIKADSLQYLNDYSKRQASYSFTLKKMGWINCDKFCNSGNKTNFVINLPADVKAENFVSQVVFMSTRSSVLPGRSISNNQIGFHGIPTNMGVYVVGIGVRNGKVVSFVQKLKVNTPEVNINDLVETTPEAFRKKLSELDMN